MSNHEPLLPRSLINQVHIGSPLNIELYSFLRSQYTVLSGQGQPVVSVYPTYYMRIVSAPTPMFRVCNYC